MADKPLILSQKVMLTGLGASTFKDAMDAMREVSMMAEREFKQGALEQWTPTSMNGVETMEITNRFFRRTREGDEEQLLTILKNIDPKGMLQQLVRPDLVHTEENVMRYFRSHVEEGGKRRYQMVKPQLFRVGDIVEAQITLAIVRGKKRMHRIKLILRAIVLLDAEFTQAAIRAKASEVGRQTMVEGNVTRGIKRKISYIEDEETDETSKKRKEVPDMYDSDETM